MNEFDLIYERTRAEKNLEKMKNYEKKTKLHTLRLNEKTIVCCKNEDRLEDYKKLK